jgi:hypothetical protein
MTKIIFWDVTPCSLVEVHGRFGGTYCLHIQGRSVSQGSNQQEVGGKQTFKMEAVSSSEMSV